MKRQILLLAITAAALSSCTTAYKTAQTPDDVYFSPARPQDEYVRVEEKDEYRYDDDYYDDRYLRMKVQNRTRWNYLDDWYSYDRYGYRYNSYYGSYYNPYTSWNYYHNPYCRNNVIIYNPKQSSVVVNVPKPRNFNLTSYTNTAYNNANSNVKMNGSKPVYNNSNSNKSFSTKIKQFVGGNNNNNSRSYDNPSSNSSPTRTYTPSNNSSTTPSSSGSSGSSSGSSGSSSGASRPSRGN
jgi:hypothetical protein